jgi:hypothetical protein
MTGRDAQEAYVYVHAVSVLSQSAVCLPVLFVILSVVKNVRP